MALTEEVYRLARLQGIGDFVLGLTEGELVVTLKCYLANTTMMLLRTSDHGESFGIRNNADRFVPPRSSARKVLKMRSQWHEDTIRIDLRE
jgi:hypothetical protein